MKRSKSVGLMVLLLLVLTAGCKPTTTPPPATPTQVQAEPTATAIPATPTPTSAPTSTNTPEPPQEPAATATFIPTPAEGAGPWIILRDLEVAHSTGMAGFLNDSFGVTVGTAGVIHYTTDGGQTWPGGVNSSWCLHGLDVVNENMAWSVGHGGRVRVSTDGARTWQAGPTLDTEIGCYVSALDDHTGWAATTRRLWAISGETWSEITLPQEAGKIAAIALRTPSDGYLLDYTGVLHVTQDGGNSWVSRTLGLWGEGAIDTNAPPAMRFFDAEHGLIVLRVKGVESHIVALRTADGGETWSEESIPVEIESYQMKLFLSPDGTSLTITAGGGQILVLRYRGI